MSEPLTEDDILIYILSRIVITVTRRDLGGPDVPDEEVADLLDKIFVKAAVDSGFTEAVGRRVCVAFHDRIGTAMDRLGIPPTADEDDEDDEDEDDDA